LDLYILELFNIGNDFSQGTIDKNRNIYYQKKLANETMNQVNNITSLVTSALNIHLNIGQNLTMNTPEAFMLLETISIKSLFDKQIKQVETAEIHIPSNLTSNLNPSTPVSLRVSFLFKTNFLFFMSFLLVHNGTTCSI
jgi:hypothetical protein